MKSKNSNTTNELDSLISSVDSLNINTSNMNDSELNENDESSINDITVIQRQESSSTKTTSIGDQSVYIKSVKEQANKLNRLNTKSQLTAGSNDMSVKRDNNVNIGIKNSVQLRDHQNSNYVKVSYFLEIQEEVIIMN